MNLIRADRKLNLWIIPLSPIIWLLHFSLTYITAAVWCAKFASYDKNMSFVSLMIALYTFISLFLIIFFAIKGYLFHKQGESELPHDDATSDDRNRFLGFVTFIVSCLSALATIYVSYVAVVFRSCF